MDQLVIGDSEEIIAGSFSHKKTATSSPFIESKASAYTTYVASVMGGRTEMEFQELLPPGATRKTACRAFSHMLSESKGPQHAGVQPVSRQGEEDLYFNKNLQQKSLSQCSPNFKLQKNPSITSTLGPEGVQYSESFGILKFASFTMDNMHYNDENLCFMMIFMAILEDRYTGCSL